MKKKINVSVVAGCSITCESFNKYLSQEKDTINFYEEASTFDELINVKNKEYKNGVTISFLIDFWKLGLKDYFRTPHRIKYVANTYSQSFT